jgi:hypothetical protein
VVYVFATALYTGGMGAALTFSPVVWYAPYVSSAVPFGVDALADQQLAGLLMWVPSALVFIAFGLGLVAAWLGHGERRARLAGPVVLILALLPSVLAASPESSGTAQTAGRQAIHLVVLGAPSGDLARGLQFGAAEANATAALMNRSLAIRSRLAGGPTPSVIVSTEAQRPGSPPPGVPVLRLQPPAAGARPCEFWLKPQGGRTGSVLWDGSLTRFGAAQLNQRFSRLFDTPMNGDAWLGWFAMKAALEIALRDPAPPCSLVPTLRFDGHKGVPLTFDPVTRVLRQPLYVVIQAADGTRVAQEAR